jgi:hypothetical protein
MDSGVARVCAATLLALAGCGGDETRPATASATSSGTGAGGGEGCDPGTRDVAAACVPAGIPEDECAAGFEASNGSCEAVLPAGACPVGQMAVPGDAACREVMDCGRAPWGVAPIDATTQHVDAAFDGTSDGSARAPWTTIAAALAAASKGAVVAIAAGTYAETLPVVNKAVRLWGRCPSLVTIQAPATAAAVLDVESSEADGAEIHGVTLTGPTTGVLVAGAENVLVDRVHIDGAIRGIEADYFGVTSVTVTGSLIERSTSLGVVSFGGTVTIDASVVRGTGSASPNPFEGNGLMAAVEMTSKRRPAVAVTRSVFEENTGIGMVVYGGDATIAGTVVRRTKPTSAGEHGTGMHFEYAAETGDVTKVTVEGSLVAENRYIGIKVIGSDLTMRTTVVRDTGLEEQDANWGVGIDVETRAAPGPLATAAVTACVLERNHGANVFTKDGTVQLDGVVLRDSLPDADGQFGYGAVATIEDDRRAYLALRGCEITRATRGGVFVVGSDADIDGTAIRDTLPDPSALGGRGITAQHALASGERANLHLTRSLVEGSRDVGVFIGSSDGTVEDTVIRGTLARASDGHIGDGLVVLTNNELPANAFVSRTRIETSARAGILAYSGNVTVSGSTLECNPIALDGEDFAGSQHIASLTDGGDNVCGCNGQSAVCQVVSSGLEPPTAIDR